MTDADDIDENKHKLYDKLQSNTGVDFEALRIKYQRAESIKNPNTSGYREEEIKATHYQLDKYKICQKCNGQGLIKQTYNHIVKQVNCDACDGDAILLDKATKSTIANLTT
jgi:DnaJ-class molecular chaperone